MIGGFGPQPSMQGRSVAESACGALGSHVCLAGAALGRRGPLLDLLRRRHAVTLVDSLGCLAGSPLLALVDVLVLDCSEWPQQQPALGRLLAERPDLCHVLVNGALEQNEIAAAFRDGAADYFARPVEPALIAERVFHLGRRFRRNAAPLRRRREGAALW